MKRMTMFEARNGPQTMDVLDREEVISILSHLSEDRRIKMTLATTRTCDFTAPKPDTVKKNRSRAPNIAHTVAFDEVFDSVDLHLADQTFTVRHGGVAYELDVCGQHIPNLLTALEAIGFSLQSMTVGKARRGAYVSKSGTPFSAREARTWLQERDPQVSGTGRLTRGQMDEYANAH